MIYEVIPTLQFEKDLKYYRKAKKYFSIEDDIEEDVISEIENGNFVGDELDNMELPEQEHVFKARAINSSANVGKSNGYRVIYYVVEATQEIYLLTVYSKKDRDSISDNEIKELIKLYCT